MASLSLCFYPSFFTPIYYDSCRIPDRRYRMSAKSRNLVILMPEAHITIIHAVFLRENPPDTLLIQSNNSIILQINHFLSTNVLIPRGTTGYGNKPVYPINWARLFSLLKKLREIKACLFPPRRANEDSYHISIAMQKVLVNLIIFLRNPCF